MTKIKSLLNWSGGKDSALCMYKILNAGEYQITHLVTTVSEKYNRISQHGVRVELLEQQSKSIGVPLHKIILPDWSTMGLYNSKMKTTLAKFKSEGVRASIFGDIFLEDLKKYREEKLAEVGLKGVFPLWKISTKQLAREFIELGFKAVIVCVDEKHLDKSFSGREFDQAFLNDLPPDVDACGEYGEFHSFVYDGPIFKKPIALKHGEITYRKYIPASPKETDADSNSGTNQKVAETGFWYCDLIPV